MRTVSTTSAVGALLFWCTSWSHLTLNGPASWENFSPRYGNNTETILAIYSSFFFFLEKIIQLRKIRIWIKRLLKKKVSFFSQQQSFTESSRLKTFVLMLAFNEVALVMDLFSLYVKCSKSKSSDEFFHKLCPSNTREENEIWRRQKGRKDRRQKRKEREKTVFLSNITWMERIRKAKHSS